MYLYFSKIGKGQPRGPPLCQLYRPVPGNCIGTLSFTVDVTGNADQLLATVVDSTLKTARARMMLARDSLVDTGRTPRLLPQKLQ